MEKISTQIKEGTYENILVDCSYCDKECIFNRVSDLQTIEAICGKDLKCEYCGKIFWAKGDMVTSAKYEWFLDDLPTLKKQKKYGLYILLLCQACEIFMHQAIINKMIDTNPEYRNKEGYFCGAGAYNTIYERFCNTKIKEITDNALDNGALYKKATFYPLRELFLHILDDARKNKLQTLNKLKKDKRVMCFGVIEDTDIHETRNDTVHKNGYRPHLDDIKKYDKLITSLRWLGVYLNVKDSAYHINSNSNDQKKYL